MSLAYIDFRGIKGVRVRYSEYRCEADYLIEWEFEDGRFPDITEVTEEEDREIVLQLLDIAAHYGDDLVDFGDVVE